ncbi:oxidoreductase [uncultured Tenacibaculum sp.]|uniref:oxidoreductase n=1 Tax=uncultured Tenacibaculum sp. TaxID=174713 RepID=UPI002622645B|nr:oxidoreductase [uncultured Tenacibaculum sp.]
MYLNKKVIVITGAAGLLGSEFCREVIDNEGVLIMAEYDVEKANELKEELKSDRVHVYQTNIISKSSVENLVKNIHEKFNRIDALVNCAYPRNKNYGRHFFDVEYNDFCENVGMNLGGYFLTSQVFSKYFLEQGYGNIINISSIYGVIAPRFEVYEDTEMTMPVEYSTIKSGLLHLTKYMAKYFRGKDIRVNAISLGGLEDGQPKAFIESYREFCLNKGMLSPKDISGTLLYLLSDLSKYVNGQNIIVDDGFTL